MSTETSPAGGLPPAAIRLGRVALHPVLLASYPTLSLWAANVDEVLPNEVWPVLWVPVAVTAATWGLLGLAMRDHRLGGAVASAMAVIVLNLGRVWPGATATAAVLLVLAVGAVTALPLWSARRTGLTVTTAVLNVLALVLVLLPLPAVMPGLLRSVGAVEAGAVSADEGPSRDIWYIVPDRYARADTLASEYGIDNSGFVDGLEARGFQVLDRARANYPKTAHSLAATWNFEYLPDLLPPDPRGDDWQPVYALLRDHRLGRTLTEAGYEYIHLGTWWSPTATAASADQVRRVDNHSEFATVWRSQTALPALLGAEEDQDESELSLRQRNRRYSSFQLDELHHLAQEPHRRPRFVLAHITVPHEPYVFDEDGSFVTSEEARARSREENYRRQLVYLNRRLSDLVDELLAGPEATHPIIVIQSDEGPHPDARFVGKDYNWLEASQADRQEKLRTFAAWYLPGVEATVPEDLTGVNTWRFILDTYLDTGLGLLEDRVFVFPDEDNLYEFHEVTDEFE